MEKITKSIKDIVIIFLITIVLIVSFNIVSSIGNVKASILEAFGVGATDIDAFDGASTNYNGGLTRKEIEEQKKNDACPTHIDMNDTVYIQDYGGVVVFYKKVVEDGKTIYPNILFVKTDDGLKFDGAMNIHGESYAGWFGMGYSFKVWQNWEEIPVYTNDSMMIFDDPADSFCDQVGFSGFITRAVQAFGKREERIAQTQKWIIDNIYPYFLTFCEENVEIIQDKGTESGDFNFFYDYLYRSAKSYDYGSQNKGTCAVNVSSLTVYPLPNELKTTYPIPSTNPQEFFGVYNCKTFLTCNYAICSPTLDFSNSKYILPGVKDDPIECKDIEEKSLANIEVSLIPSGNYVNNTIRNIVNESPVKIEFFKDSKLTNTLVFNSEKFLNATGSVVNGFEKGSYTYKITSNQLLFDSFSGSLTITQSSTVKIKYSYQNGKVLSSFSISPASNDVDYLNIDLSTYPVILILNNQDKTETIQFTFDSLEKINKKQSSVIALGKYTYTILSEKLMFGSTSGSIEISPENRNFDFSFAVIYNRSDLDFSVSVSTSSSSTNGRITLSGNASSVNLLSSKLGLTNYFVNISLFDAGGNFVKTLTHTHNGSGGCSDSWTVSNLVNGSRYIAQMTYANGSDASISGYIEYQSSTFSFDYKTATSYTFTYACTEV